jgi:hypothetical protein
MIKRVCCGQIVVSSHEEGEFLNPRSFFKGKGLVHDVETMDA